MAERQVQDRRILKAAGLISIATLMSRVLGLVREQVFAIFFGASHLTDAFQVAFRIPNLLRDLFAEGAMSSSLVPTFTRVREQQGDRRAWRIAGLVFRILLIGLGIGAVVGVICTPTLVRLYAPGFQSVPGKLDLTISLTRWMFPFFPLVALAAAFMGILNACGVFFMPAFSSALFNVVSVAVGVILIQGFGFSIEAMAIGVLAGGLVQALSQLPSLYRVGYRWSKRLPGEEPWHREPQLKRMLWLMVPGTVGLAATQVNLLINTILATAAGAGAVSWLNYAFRLMQFPIGVFGVSLATAILPQIARAWVREDYPHVVHSIEQGLKNVFAINLPASAGLIALGIPIIELIYQHGHFSAGDTGATAQALAMYSVGLTFYSAVKVLGPACYALDRSGSAVRASVVSVIVTLFLNTILVRRYGHWGLALGTSVAAFFNAALLFISLRRALSEKGQALPFLGVGFSFLKNTINASLMGFACFWLYQKMAGLWPGAPEPWGRIARLLPVLVSSGFFLIFFGRLLKIPEINALILIFISRIKGKLSRGGRYAD